MARIAKDMVVRVEAGYLPQRAVAKRDVGVGVMRRGPVRALNQMRIGNPLDEFRAELRLRVEQAGKG
jgi:hypothetical protein